MQLNLMYFIFLFFFFFSFFFFFFSFLFSFFFPSSSFHFFPLLFSLSSPSSLPLPPLFDGFGTGSTCSCCVTLQNGIVDPFRFGTFSVQYVLFLVMMVLVLIPEPRRTDFVPHDKDDVSPLEILLSPVQKSKDKSYVLNGCREFPVQRKMPHFCLVSHGGGKTDRCGRAGDTHWCTMTLLTYATKTSLRWWPVASR